MKVVKSQMQLITIGVALLTLLAACSTAPTVPTITPTSSAAVIPSITPTPIPILLPTDTPNLTPSATSALLTVPSASPLPSITAFVPQPGDAPPLTLKLPTGWRSTYTRVPVTDQTGEALVNIAAYAGPVADKGTGFIYVLWNYPSLLPIDPAALPASQPDLIQNQLYSDGLRLLQGTILDAACTFGNYGHSTFPIGGQTAYGQLFQASGCPENAPDVAGWYAGIYQNGQNLLFYAYVQPVSAFNNGRQDVQHVLDSVVFSPGAASPGGVTAAPATAAAQPASHATASPSGPPTGTPELD